MASLMTADLASTLPEISNLTVCLSAAALAYPCLYRLRRSLSCRGTRKPLPRLSLSLPKPALAVRVSASASASSSSSPRGTVAASASRIPTESPLSDSTRTVRYVVGTAASLCAVLAKWAHSVSKTSAPTAEELASLRSLQSNVVWALGPLFFAAKNVDLDSSMARIEAIGKGLSTPLSVVAAGMAKWLDIYSGVLMIRVLLSWFPNIPWDRQPLSAIRDLCDPYLNLFRNVIPPLFNTLDVSPLLAFAILGVLSSLLTTGAVPRVG